MSLRVSSLRGWEGLGQEASSVKRAVSSGEAVATWTVAGLSFRLKTAANAGSLRRQPFPGMGVKTQNSNPTSLAKQKGPILCVCVFFFFPSLKARECLTNQAVSPWRCDPVGDSWSRATQALRIPHSMGDFRHQEGPHLSLSLRSSGLAFPVVGEEGHC